MRVFHPRKTIAVGAVILGGMAATASPALAAGPDHVTPRQLIGDCAHLDAEGAGTTNDDQTGMGRGHLDKCEFQEKKTFTQWHWETAGPIISNCQDGSTKDLDEAIAIGHTFTRTHTFGALANVTIAGVLQIGGDYQESWSKSTTQTSTVTMHVRPGHKAVMRIGNLANVHEGTIKLNYDTRVAGHYEWYVDNYYDADPTDQFQQSYVEVECKQNLPTAPVWTSDDTFHNPAS